MMRPCLLFAVAVAACAGKSPAAPAAAPVPPPRLPAPALPSPAPASTVNPLVAEIAALERATADHPTVNPLVAEIAALERATADHPEDARAWARLATALGRGNRVQEAARAAWRTVELAPTAESWQLLAEIFVQGGAPNAAMAALEEVSRQSNDGFAAAQNYLDLGLRAWRWGMDDFAVRAYERADALAPGHPMVLHNRILMLASAGRAQLAQGEATKLRNVVDRILEDRPPPEMVALLEPMTALTDAVLAGDPIPRQPPLAEPGQRLPDRFWRREPARERALDLGIDATSERFYPLAGWKVLRLTVPATWVDRLAVPSGTGHPLAASLRFDARPDEAKAVRWLLTVSERRADAPALDQLVAEARRALPGKPVLGEVRSFTGTSSRGRSFVADDPSARPDRPEDFPRLVHSVIETGGFLVVSTRLLRDTGPEPLAQTDEILESIEVRDLTPRPAER